MTYLPAEGKKVLQKLFTMFLIYGKCFKPCWDTRASGEGKECLIKTLTKETILHDYGRNRTKVGKCI